MDFEKNIEYISEYLMNVLDIKFKVCIDSKLEGNLAGCTDADNVIFISKSFLKTIEDNVELIILIAHEASNAILKLKNVLKDDSKIIFTFNNNDLKTWNAL